MPRSPSRRQMIGDFRIVRELGHGGMGVVYEAQQQHPNRPVALKVIRGGAYVDETAIKLFEREAQALARLKHPSIAAIYESGRTEDGQHYFAMELVRGQTLTDWMRERPTYAASTREEIRIRFGLVRRICEAVAYAHQRGVVHRDIKPSNVLVLREPITAESSLSGIPDVKILDFGLARITDTDVAASAAPTEAGQLRGTLRYMSPEQVRANPDEIDLRTDVYSLGVLLYELLTGHLPLALEGNSLVEVARIICEVPAAHLSRHWGGARKPDRDLETIVGKALEKNPAERYQSVTAMSEDLKRYLAHQPITARHPNALYQLRKMIGRHKIGFAFAASVVVLLAALAIGTTLQARSIEKERDRANLEAATAEEVSSFLVKLFQVVDPSKAQGNQVTAREILDKGALKIRSDLQSQPLVQGRLMHVMGDAYTSLGLYDDARPLSREGLDILIQELGEDHLRVARSRNSLAILLGKTGDYDTAGALFDQALETLETVLGPDHLEVAGVQNDKAALLFRTGDYEGARELYENSLSIRENHHGPDHKDVAASLTNLALVLRKLGRYEEVVPLAERAIKIQERRLGPNHPDLAASLNSAGNAYLRLERYEEAKGLYERALRIREKILGPDHDQIGSALNNLGSLHLLAKDYDAALPLYERALRIREDKLGPRHPDTATTLNNMAELLGETGELNRARRLYERALSIRESTLDPGHTRIASTLDGLADLLLKTGEHDRAREYYGRALEIYETAHGREHPKTAHALTGLGDLAVATGDLDGALAYYEEAREIRLRKLPSNHSDVGESFYKLARLAALEGRTDRAVTLCGQAVDHGYSEPDFLDEPAFTDLRRDPAYAALAAKLEERLPAR